MKRFVGIILMLLLLPALAMAQEAAVMSGGTELIDWTALVVAVIGVIGTAAVGADRACMGIAM